VFYYNDPYEYPLPAGHRFPMEKYRIVRERLERDITSAEFRVSPLVSHEDLLTTHDASYVRRFLDGELSAAENRRIGFPWSVDGVRRALSSTGGTVAAARCVAEALRSRQEQRNDGASKFAVAGHIAGGTHHARADAGAGFCVFSDIAVATNVLRRDFADVCRRVLIVDLDVHQGDGNAVIFADDPGVFTFSLHAADNVAWQAERVASDCDVALATGAGDDTYLRMLRAYLPLLRRVAPDVVFYQAGVDPSEHDRLGKLNVTRRGLRRRNDLVFETCRRLDVPVVVTMGGGYPRDLDPASPAYQEIVHAHVDVYAGAAAAALRDLGPSDG